LVDAGVLEDDSFKQIKELTIKEGNKKNNTTVVYIEEVTKN
jgi:Holliday junction resolvase RusA-like endonuclease